MKVIIVRKAEKKDADQIYEFVCGLENTIFDKVEFIKLFHVCLELKQHIYLVAEVDHQAIGFLSCHGQLLLHHMGWVYEIQELFVMPQFRNRGAGRILLQHLDQLLADENCILLEVASNRIRIDAHRFYLKNGFEKTSYKFGKILI